MDWLTVTTGFETASQDPASIVKAKVEIDFTGTDTFVEIPGDLVDSIKGTDKLTGTTGYAIANTCTIQFNNSDKRFSKNVFAPYNPSIGQYNGPQQSDTRGNLRPGRKVRVSVSVGVGNEWLQRYAGFVGDNGFVETIGAANSNIVTINCVDLGKYLKDASLKTPGGATPVYIDRKISDPADQGNSLVHIIGGLVGLSPGDIIADTIPILETYSPLTGSAWDELAYLAEVVFATLTVTPDNKVFFGDSRYATGYTPPTSQFTFNNDNAFNIGNPDDFANIRNDITLKFSIPEWLEKQTIWQFNLNYDTTTGKCNYVIPAGDTSLSITDPDVEYSPQYGIYQAGEEFEVLSARNISNQTEFEDLLETSGGSLDVVVYDVTKYPARAVLRLANNEALPVTLEIAKIKGEPLVRNEDTEVKRNDTDSIDKHGKKEEIIQSKYFTDYIVASGKPHWSDFIQYYLEWKKTPRQLFSWSVQIPVLQAQVGSRVTLTESLAGTGIDEIGTVTQVTWDLKDGKADMRFSMRWELDNPTAPTDITPTIISKSGDPDTVYSDEGLTERPLYTELRTVFPDYLLSHWNLDTLDAVDSTINKNNGTVYGTPTIVPGLAGDAMEFNGTTDYVDVDGLDYANQQATMTMIVKFDTFASDQTLWVEGGNVNGWELSILSGSLIFGARDDAVIKTISIPTSILATGVWYMITAIIDLTYNKMTLILNGEEKGINDLTGITDYQGSQAATIAALFDDSPISGTAPDPGNYSRFFDGTIQHVAIYSRALNLIETIQLSGNPGADTIDQKALPQPPRDRFAGYAFDAISEAKVITDVFGDGYDAIAETGVTLEEGRVGNAVKMNGTGQYVTILGDTGRAALMSSGVFSISLWVKSESTAGDSLARIITADASEYFALSVNQAESGNQSSRWYYGPATFQTLDDFIPVDKLTHIVMTWDTNLERARIYKDSVLIDEQATISFPSTTRSVIIGENLEATPQPGTDPFVGLIDQLGFWTKELTIDEITDLFLNPAFDRTRISGDTVRTGRIISNATGVGGNPKSVYNLDLGSFYAGDGGFTFGTDTFIYWDPATAKYHISGDVTISGTLSGVDGTFSGNLSSTGTITFTTLRNTNSKIELSGDQDTVKVSKQPSGWDLTGPTGTTFAELNGNGVAMGRNVSGTWLFGEVYIVIDGTRNAMNVKGDLLANIDNTYDLGRTSPSNKRWRDLYLSGNADIGGNLQVDGYLQVDAGGDAIREKQFANVSIGANSSLTVATFLGSTNTVYCSATHREASTTARNDPKTSQATVGSDRVVTGWNTAATTRTIQFLMEQAY
jgi:hypothetical protein